MIFGRIACGSLLTCRLAAGVNRTSYDTYRPYFAFISAKEIVPLTAISVRAFRNSLRSMRSSILSIASTSSMGTIRDDALAIARDDNALLIIRSAVNHLGELLLGFCERDFYHCHAP